MVVSDLPDRFQKLVSVQASGCWEWLGNKNSHGYGRISIHSRRFLAHRVVYELLAGKIPDGLQIDHLCRVRHCVNPAHLEPVTAWVNQARGQTLTADNIQKTHCPNGHPYDGDNLFEYELAPDKKHRQCKVCRREHGAKWRERNREYLRQRGREYYRLKCEAAHG